ncbi:GNAT family N-acetyltransferase [Octadecabacter sp. G9-8]|uniref:GNAT family N-acetyltransferase n=1 Tax=Octadecabacter dasysiphoniae TaxID=2909341 RepID=A0ABS9CXH2_9RHOB|nr:GNAT family protein [Octadecabacter dasysiphoniae]MCF2870768.1 GNAT family N-acetyltransferase [Octadecabacter dasysiphoniae]
MTDTTQTIQPVIETDRFLLRPLQMSDKGLLELHLGDQRVAKMTRSIPHPLPPEYIAGRIERAGEDDTNTEFWVIDGSAFDHAEVMGVLKLTRLDRNQSELRYWVAPAFWNTGIATQAVDAILQANPQGACDIYAEVFQDNPTSARILTNAGFAYLGDAETFSVARNGVVPTWTYARKMGAAA